MSKCQCNCNLPCEDSSQATSLTETLEAQGYHSFNTIRRVDGHNDVVCRHEGLPTVEEIETLIELSALLETEVYIVINGEMHNANHGFVW